ncbi:sigma-70 family RNA polymerase sigma factor [Paenibacillus sp. KN14-4R]|uniref:sigma-70 family RNA polymerase sigma factor n=1 Tax=Paenibacillus sp. KN14-4R TaxID=3445773 RepID=UPI003FA0151D
MDLETLYRTYKQLLLSVAYKLLGSYTEAEDALQDIFVSLRDVELESITHPKAYLVKMITNHSLNRIKSAQRKRELYTGPWLPEPVISLGDEEPSAYLIRQEIFGYALLVLMQKLTPLERAVFVLRESLGFEYPEIAEMLHKTEAACRKIYSRAKAKLGSDLPHETAYENADPFVQAFAKAVESGRFEPFIQLLTEDAVLLSDGGGKVRAAIFPILGRERVSAFLEGVSTKGSLQGDIRLVWIGGQRGILITRPDMPPKAICFGYAPDNQRINAVYFIVNPEKLTHVTNITSVLS